MLRESIMDLHVMVRMSESTEAERLPQEEEDLLRRANITLRYLPKAKEDTFFTAMMEKFVVLEYEEYDRILFMDADVLPLCNLDYLLVHSMTGRLKPNVVLAWHSEPASGGFFILQPGKKKRLDEIVEERRKRQVNKTEYFDSYLGWGQPRM
jgi:alpha-N-acetylglucosamine transferase